MTEGKDSRQSKAGPPPVEGKIEIRRGIVPDKPPEGQADQVKDRRGRPVYLARTKRRIPPWLIASLVFFTLMAALFILVPILAQRTSDLPGQVPTQESLPDQGGDLLLREDLAVVKVPLAPLFERPDRTSARLAEALFNERVSLLDSRDRDFLLVRLHDGVQGYMRRDHLSADKSSLLADPALAKLVVRQPAKRIMSHARQGALLVEVPMGTVLYADYRNGDLLRVRLPDRKTGWVNSSGVILLDPRAGIETGDLTDQVLVATMMAFYNSPRLPGGASVKGISLEGALYVSGLVNGLDFPRDRKALMAMGNKVSLPRDGEGVFDLSYLEEGDLVFFHSKGDKNRLESLAMRVADGQLLLDSPDRSTLRMIDLESREAKSLASRLMEARRYLPGP